MSSQRKECNGFSALTSTATRRIPTTASLKISNRLWASSVPNIVRPVTLPPERGEASRKAQRHRIGNRRQDNGIVVVCRFSASAAGVPSEDTMTRSGIEAHQLLRKFVVRFALTECRSVFDHEGSGPRRSQDRGAQPSAHQSSSGEDGRAQRWPRRATLWLLRESCDRKGSSARPPAINSAASCPSPLRASGDSIVTAQMSALIGAGSGFAAAT